MGMRLSVSSIGLSVSGSDSSKNQQSHRIPKVPLWLDDGKEEIVELYVYDMTKGLSPAFSALFSKFDFDALWHTSIVIFNVEYSFGQQGMRVGEPGKPTKKINLGCTYISKRVLYEYLIGLQENVFNQIRYDIFHKNCNTFSETLSQFLTNKSIPFEYRTFGRRMYDNCVRHYNISTQEQLYEYLSQL